jgi:hypothetical protein
LLRRLPAAYLAVVVVVAVARAVSGHPSASTLALTPDRLGAGKVWLFVTSAVIANGWVLPQVLGLGAALLVAVRRLGGTFTGALMIVAHVGSTLLAYGTLVVLTGDADGAHNRNLDYGVSAVWLGSLGALTVAALARPGRRHALVAALGAAVFIASVALFPLLAATEHGFAFAIGVAAAFLREPRSAARRSARYGASTEYGPAESA